MTTQLSTCFLNYGLGDLNCNRCSNMRQIVACPRLFPASCKMRQRNISSQQKRAKKVYPENPPENRNYIMNVAEDSSSDSDAPGTLTAPVSGQELVPVADASLGSSAHQFRSMDLARQATLQ